MNILQTKTYELTEEEYIPITKKWLGREGLQLMQTFTILEKELFSTLGEKFKLHSNKTILSRWSRWADYKLCPQTVNAKNMTEGLKSNS